DVYKRQEVMAAHNIPYVAQTTITPNFKDLHEKSEKAIYKKGPAFMNVLAPCPGGWRYDTQDLMEICKIATDTCVWPLYEVEDGQWRLNYKPKKKLPVDAWLESQGRFKHMFKKENKHMIEEFQRQVDQKWENLLRRCGEPI
ncbi:MAG: pyruvate ferredoxin oxidoreductase, partial [Candidatus Pacearchaeota archaeon]|nr:pyruvate ferredoxin oxidoreductase [Candidatus Pacearchaeota archaeon]